MHDFMANTANLLNLKPYSEKAEQLVAECLACLLNQFLLPKAQTQKLAFKVDEIFNYFKDGNAHIK